MHFMLCGYLILLRMRNNFVGLTKNSHLSHFEHGFDGNSFSLVSESVTTLILLTSAVRLRFPIFDLILNGHLCYFVCSCFL